MKIKGRKRKKKSCILIYYLIRYSTKGGRKKKDTKYGGKLRTVSKLQYGKIRLLPSVCSSVCSIIHILISSFKGLSLMATFHLFSGKTDEH